MSRLFAELYLDEDVSALVAELLRARGFDALTTHEAGRKGAKTESSWRMRPAGGGRC